MKEQLEVIRKYQRGTDTFKRETITISLPPQLINEFTRQCNVMNLSRSKVIERLIEDFMTQEN